MIHVSNVKTKYLQKKSNGRINDPEGADMAHV